METTLKRAAEEEFVPALVRIPSDNPSCSSDCILIEKDEFKIGRKADNDSVILNVLISRNHCVLKYDKANDNWCVTNLSSTDTLLNDKCIERNKTEIIKEGDILQLSLSDSFKYVFKLINKPNQCIKQPKLDTNANDFNIVLNQQKSFVKSQENERKDLEKQLAAKQEEQEKLTLDLKKLLEEQKVTKTSNEELNNQITELQNKIKVSSSMELELQQKYKELLEKLEEERLKFEAKLAEEKQRWQEALKETKQEKEKLEMSMVEQMEEWREKLEQKQQQEWQKKIDNLLQEEKSVQTKLQDEKQLLEQKLKEMEQALKEKEEQQQQQQEQQKNELNLQDAIVIEEGVPPAFQQFTILETIDLTGGNDTGPDLSNRQGEAVIDKVNNIMDEQLTCSICSELFIRAMTLNCMHTFCKHCIDMWIKRRIECPTCRTQIVNMTRSLVVDNFIEKMLESLTPEQMEKRKQLIEERRVLDARSRRVVTKKKVCITRRQR